jgi:GxxExxY protein
MLTEPGEELDALAHAVIGAAIEVHRHLGPGYLEGVYEEALAYEFQMRMIPFEKQKVIAVNYKGVPVGEERLDFLVDERLIIELKAVDEINERHKAQVLSYLKTTKHPLGLLINFNVRVLKEGLRRIILS